MSGRRALHFVFKVGDRQKTIRFYKDILGMKVYTFIFEALFHIEGILMFLLFVDSSP